MSDAYDQLVAALRAISAQTGDPLPTVTFALQAIALEKSDRCRQGRSDVPGRDAPTAMSIYAR